MPKELNLNAMLDAWYDEWGRGAWLPALAGPSQAAARARVLAALLGHPVPASTGMSSFQRLVARVLEVDLNQDGERVDEDICASLRPHLARRHSQAMARSAD